jgi:serine/threonine-protein kinase
VTDFGIARVFGAARQTRLGYVVGTLAYMAPEQIMPERFGGQEADGRADLYALGIVLYEMLTGRVPFDAQSDYSLMRAQVEEPPPPPGAIAAVPGALEAIVLRALAKAPGDRFKGAAEFREALLGAEKEFGGEVPRPTRLAAPVPETRWAGSALPTPAPVAVLPSEPGGVAQASTVGRWLRNAASQRLNWRHYTSIAALAVMAVSLVLAYAWRSPQPQPAGGAQPAPAMRVDQTQHAAATPVVPPEASTTPDRPVAPPDMRAPEVPPLSPGPSPRPVKRTPSRPAERPVVPPPAESPVQPPAQPKEPAALPADVPALPQPEPTKEASADVPSDAATPVAPLTFTKVKLVLAEGTKTRELDAQLTLRSDRVVIIDGKRGSLLKEFRYASIRGAVYSQSKHPRWKTGLGAAAAVGVFAAPFFFLKSTKHWLTLQTDDDFAVLQLDKDNYRVILPALETRSRVSVERAPAEK